MCIRINDTCQGINTVFEQSDRFSVAQRSDGFKRFVAILLALFKICVEAYPASPIPAQPRSQFAEFCTTPLLSSVWNHAR